MQESRDVRTAHISVPGATLYYKTQGDGPLLLLLQGGDGDADASDALVAHLVNHFTVCSYDRRGLSRSLVDDPSAPVDLATHSDDAARLLAAVSDRPVAVFGTSLGALLGLDLLSRHPERVRLLVAHEPPATEMLAEPERSRAASGQEEIETAYRTGGVAVAMTMFVALTGIRFDDREPEVALPEPTPGRLANFEFFLTHDSPAVRRYRLNLSALASFANRIVPAAGRNSETFARHCSEALAVQLRRPMVEFPGGHIGSLMRPREFADRLLQVLAEERDGIQPTDDHPFDAATKR